MKTSNLETCYSHPPLTSSSVPFRQRGKCRARHPGQEKKGDPPGTAPPSPRVTPRAEAPLPPTRAEAPPQPSAPRVTTHAGAPPRPTRATDGRGPAERPRGLRVRPAAAWPQAGRSCGEPGGGGDRSPGAGARPEPAAEGAAAAAPHL